MYISNVTTNANYLLFSSNNKIWSLDSNNNLNLLVSDFLNPRSLLVSQDGNFLFFVANTSSGSDIYLYSFGSKKIQKITYLNYVYKISCFVQNKVFFSSKHNSSFRESSLYSIDLSNYLDDLLIRDYYDLPILNVENVELGYANDICFINSLKNSSELFQSNIVLHRNGYGYERWKGYRGGLVGELLTNKNGKFERINDVSNKFFSYGLGNPECPKFYKDRLFFISEKDGLDCVKFHELKLAEENVEYEVQQRNIFSCDLNGENIVQHTFHDDFSVFQFSICDSSGKLVYVCAGDLFTLDLHFVDSSSQKINIQNLYGEFQSIKKVDFSRNIQDFDIDNTGKNIAVISRGKIITMEPWLSGSNIIGKINVRYKFVKIFEKKIISIFDDGSNDHIEIHSLEDNSIITISNIISPNNSTDLGRVLSVYPSRNGEFLLVINHRCELVLIKLEDYTKSNKLDENEKIEKPENTENDKNKDELDSEIHNKLYDLLVDVKIGEAIVIDSSKSSILDADWSFDSRFIVYTIKTGSSALSPKSQIKIYDLLENKHYVIIDNDFMNFSPKFCPSGNYLYFLSQAVLKPEWGGFHFAMNFSSTCKPYLVLLNKSVVSPFALGENFTDVSEKTVIEFENINNRVIEFPVEEGDFIELFAMKDKLLWMIRDDKKNIIEYYDFHTLKSDELLSEVDYFIISADTKWSIYSYKNKIRVLKSGEKPEPQDSYKNNGWIDEKNINILIDRKKEYLFIFDEVVRLQKDFFWSKFVSDQLDKIAERYKNNIHKISNRSELNDIINEFHGELMCSHSYILHPGDVDFEKENFSLLGAKFSFCDQITIDGQTNKCSGYKIESILPTDLNSISPLLHPDSNLSVGDYIISMNGYSLDQKFSPEKFLENYGDIVSAKIVSNNQVKNINLHPIRSTSELLYRKWVNNNRNYVYQTTNNQIGYVHIPDMSTKGFSEFYRGYLLDRSKKALVIDVRYNGGGNISTLILEKISQIKMGYDISQWGDIVDYPTESRQGKIVFLCNGATGSDGDMFTMAVKSLKLGPVIGKRTWGGVVGIETRFELIDGGATSQPEYAFILNSGKTIENVGVYPDEDIDIMPEDYASGSDPQLKRACEILMQDL
jgi:tricorn protease